jgi:conjugative relaxase-like TrwC/TraI family protein
MYDHLELHTHAPADDHGRFSGAAGSWSWSLVMAVVVTLSKGYDLDYIWRQVDRSGGKRAADYYIQASEGGGEPPGRWWGRGAAALGFEQGQVVERGPYDLLFGERKAPDGTQLGRRPAGAQATAELYAKLLAAEPHSTAERKRELAIEAASRARRSPLYFDLTVSLSKSISIFHASLGENARQARLAGDLEGAAYWDGLIGEMDEMIWAAVRVGFDYLQREAGYTRTGSHARRVHGRETGQWHEADLVVAHWLQHASRDGDMQLHVHSQIAHVARTEADEKWRAPDSYGYNEHIGAVAAITSQHLEEALTARFGVEWVLREDRHGYEIKGISGAMMRLFSSRRDSITADLRTRVREFASRYGREPSQRELAQLAQASNFATRARKEAAPLDFDALHAGWADRLTRTLGVSLASVAPSVWGESSRRRTDPERGGAGRAAGRGLTRVEVRRAGQVALALAQRERSTFTRADVIRHLGRVLPRTGLDPAAAARLLEDLADRALAGEFEPVVCLEAPEAVAPPRDLIRADGRSVYQRHGGIRYATHRQLILEERLVAQAQAQGAPAMTRKQAARALGACVTQLDAALTQPAPDAQPDLTRTGLRVDQAAAAYAALTDRRRVTVINAPAGSGKTRVLTASGQAWSRAGLGRVVGITPSQSSRNTLAAGVPESYKSAQFLGDLPGRPGARGPVWLRPGDLVLVDEASMESTRAFADIVDHAGRSGAKVIVAGDTEQLQAVEDGGGMTLLADTLGYVRLAEPVRFEQAWERAASLRLRAGDASVLAEYDQHGRIIGGEPDEVMDVIARDYVALRLEGREVLLMAPDHSRRRELSRRIRDDLVHLGIVSPGPAARLSNGAEVSAGDWIVCTENDRRVEAGEPGRTLANGDLLRVEAVTNRGLVVRRALPSEPGHGGMRWTGRRFLYADYNDSELGYAVTEHVAQSRTVDSGQTLVTGQEDRQHLYVGMSRATRLNLAYVFTCSPKIADPVPGPRPAPELARHDRLQALRAGQVASDADPGSAERHSAAIGVLADVLSRDGQELSATGTLRRNLADADHLAILHAIWTTETTPIRDQRYRDLLAAALPTGHPDDLGPKARWLWRTLRTAELAGIDPGQVLKEAIGQRSLSSAYDLAAVIDSRIRQRVRGLVPQPARPWSAQVPQLPDPQRQDYLTHIAQAMDERKERIGEHANEHQPAWAVNALGEVPADSLARLDWQRRTSSIGAYRELYGYHNPAEPIGPEPAGDSPDKRAAWHEAFTALRLEGDAEVRAMPDGELHCHRAAYRVETAWAPPWVGNELRQVRRGAADARLAAIRARAEAGAARRGGRHDAAARHKVLAASYQSMAAVYSERETLFAAVMADRQAWDQATAARRRLAVAADAELRRRHPRQQFPPLRSAEPEPVTEPQRGELALAPGTGIPEPGAWLSELAAGREVFAGQLAEKQDRPQISQHPDSASPGECRSWRPPAEPLLRPPKPEIRPSARVLERVNERQTDREAGA